MLSPLVMEVIKTDKWYCQCNPACMQKTTLPDDVADMLLNDVTLILVIEGCTAPPAGRVIKEGEGWKVYKPLAEAPRLPLGYPLGDRLV